MRAAASACLVASGLLISGVGGAMALADPGQGQDRSDPTDSDEAGGAGSVGAIVRRAFGMDDGNRATAANPWQRPAPRWGNGRGLGEDEVTKTETQPTRTPTETKTPTSKPCPSTKPTEPSKPPGGPPEPRPPLSFPGGGGAIEPLPRYKPPSVPEMQLPGELQPNPPGLPGAPGVLEAGAGAAVAVAPAGPAVPIALPVIVAPPLGPGIGGGSGTGPRAGPSPGDVKSIFAEPPAGRSSPPANVGSNAAMPNASYRIGYPEYLRTAGLPQVAAMAVPGLVGIMVLTGAGGLVGYRQAKAGHAVHVGGPARFMR